MPLLFLFFHFISLSSSEFDIGQSVFISNKNATNAVTDIGTIISQQSANEYLVRLNTPPFTLSIVNGSNLRSLSLDNLPRDIKQKILSYLQHDIEIGFRELIECTDISAKDIYNEAVEFPHVAVSYDSLPEFMYSQPFDHRSVVRGYYYDHSTEDQQLRDPQYSFLAFKVRDYSSKYQAVAVNVIVFVFHRGRILMHVVDDHRGRMNVGNSIKNQDVNTLMHKIRDLFRYRLVRIVTHDRRHGLWRNQLFGRSDVKHIIQWESIVTFGAFWMAIIVAFLYCFRNSVD